MSGILNVLLAVGGSGRTVIQVFTSTQNWKCPTGVTSVDYLVVAGGGSGGGVGRVRRVDG